MSIDVKHQVVARMKEAKKSSLQLDESTNIGKPAQLMVFTRYEGQEDRPTEEEFIFYAPLETTTTGEKIFALVDEFLKKEGLLLLASASVLMALRRCWALSKVLSPG